MSIPKKKRRGEAPPDPKSPNATKRLEVELVVGPARAAAGVPAGVVLHDAEAQGGLAVVAGGRLVEDVGPAGAGAGLDDRGAAAAGLGGRAARARRGRDGRGPLGGGHARDGGMCARARARAVRRASRDGGARRRSGQDRLAVGRGKVVLAAAGEGGDGDALAAALDGDRRRDGRGGAGGGRDRADGGAGAVAAAAAAAAAGDRHRRRARDGPVVRGRGRVGVRAGVAAQLEPVVLVIRPEAGGQVAHVRRRRAGRGAQRVSRACLPYGHRCSVVDAPLSL
ncbi:uncharacterized protein V1510DRAFT_419634 [Dipodascopsis tothii]|uniref:uncharacterized protein n=1 Tax=Dipodascopsis tothii TaxID=44089 RepID=UPI0034CD6AFD